VAWSDDGHWIFHATHPTSLEIFVKITHLETFPVTYQLARPGAPVDGPVSKGPFDSVLIRIHGDNGQYGVGEAPAHQIYLGDSNAHILRALTLIEEVIKGEDPWDIGRLHQKMRHVTGSIASKVPEAARTAVDMALYDLMGKEVGKPVYQLLNGGLRKTFTVFGTEYGQTLEEKLEQIQLFLDRGFTGVETKLFVQGDVTLGAVQEKARMLRTILEKVPESFEVMADCNLRWGPASNVIMAVRGYQLDHHPNLLLEQPVPYADLSGLQRIRAAVSCPIISDESSISAEMVFQLGCLRAADVICVKLPRVGGLYPARQVIAAAESAGLAVKTDSGVHGKIADTATVHLASCTQLAHPVSDGWTWLSPDCATGGIEIDAEGRVQLPESPGLGVDFDESIARSIRWKG